ncbi:MAG TPA: ribonuclease P protein component [Candidatus Eremiobacteraceae bacterium]|nr:ribonuclease P protein component [Candidatus Eremiobacteraceae bacterium]
MRRYASLRGRREFTVTVRRGVRASTKALTVFALQPKPRSAGIARAGIVVNRKVGGAVVRNLLRRRCKAILDEALGQPDGFWYVVQCAPAAAELPFATLRGKLLAAMKRVAGSNAP